MLSDAERLVATITMLIISPDTLEVEAIGATAHFGNSHCWMQQSIVGVPAWSLTLIVPAECSKQVQAKRVISWLERASLQFLRDTAPKAQWSLPQLCVPRTKAGNAYTNPPVNMQCDLGVCGPDTKGLQCDLKRLPFDLGWEQWERHVWRSMYFRGCPQPKEPAPQNNRVKDSYGSIAKVFEGRFFK